MKINLFTILFSLCVFVTVGQQDLLKYQAVARDANGTALVNQNIGIRFSIVEDNAQQDVQYIETHSTNTSDLGIFYLNIGAGEVAQGDFSQIDWASNDHFLKVELDISGGSNYVDMGSIPFLSVPYALHAKTVRDKDDADADPTNEIQSLSKNGNEVTLSNGGGTFTDEVNDMDADPSNEIQSLEINGSQLSISGGNTVNLPTGGGNGSNDDDPNNEVQNLTRNGTDLTLSISADVVSIEDDDSNPTNEIQSLQLNGTKLSLTDSNEIDLSAIQDGVNDADADPQNEIQDLQLENGLLSLSNSNSMIYLEALNTFWKKLPFSEIIEYKAANAVVGITDSVAYLNLAPDYISISDETDCVSFLDNGNLSYSNITTISPDLELINEVAAFGKDSLHFENVSTDAGEFSRATYSRDFAALNTNIGSEKWNASLEPVQLDLRINNDEAWGNYDAYGLQAITNGDAGILNDWQLYLKAGLGLYQGEENPQGLLDVSFTNPYGFYLGDGPGLGILDNTYTMLDKDSLTFDYMLVNGLSSGFASYGRDQLNMNFQAGGQSNSSCFSPFNLCLETDDGGVKRTMDLNTDYIEFDNPNFGFSFTHLGLDSLHLGKTVGLLFPDYATLKPSGLEFENFANTSYYGGSGFSIQEIINPSDIFDRVALNPDEFIMTNAAKWLNVRLGTRPTSNSGQLDLWSGTGDFKLVEIGEDILDPLGGSVELFSNNSGSHAHAWLRAQNGKGELTLDGPSSLNVYIGNIQGENLGGVQVYNGDGNGIASASMYADTNDDGVVTADFVYVGEHPGNNAKYPFKTVQNDGFGIDLESSDGSNNWEWYVNGNGDLGLYANGSSVGSFDVATGVYNSISDRRLKSNIRTMDNVLSKVIDLNVSRYNYKINNPSQKESIGFIAQEVKELFPELVKQTSMEKSKGVLSLDYSGFGVLAIKAIQEQQKIIEQQSEELSEVKKEMKVMKEMIEKLMEK